MTTEPTSAYGLIEAEMAAEMRLDPANLTAGDRRRLGTGTALALKIDEDQRKLRDGERVDFAEHARDQKALAELVALPGAPAGGVDLSLLDDTELELFGWLTQKALGVDAASLPPPPLPAPGTPLAEKVAEIERMKREHDEREAQGRGMTSELKSRRRRYEAAEAQCIEQTKRAETAERELVRLKELNGALEQLNKLLGERIGRH
jgi:hypothetical protein